MGVYYNSYVIFGMRVVLSAERRPDLYRTTTHDSCEHPERHGAVFCPVCGKAVATTTTTSRTENLYEILDVFQGDLPPGCIFARDDDGDSGVLGFGAWMDRDRPAKVMPLPDFEAIREEVRRILDEQGLLDEDTERTFGMHVGTQTS